MKDVGSIDIDNESQSAQGEGHSDEDSFPSHEFWKEQEVELDDNDENGTHSF